VAKVRSLGPNHVSEIKLVPSSGGVFEVVADGRLIYSKKKTGQHADLDVLASEIQKI